MEKVSFDPTRLFVCLTSVWLILGQASIAEESKVYIDVGIQGEGPVLLSLVVEELDLEFRGAIFPNPNLVVDASLVIRIPDEAFTLSAQLGDKVLKEEIVLKDGCNLSLSYSEKGELGMFQSEQPPPHRR